MTYRTLQHCVADLERSGHLVRLSDPVDARLEAAEIQRRVFRSCGPAVLFENVKGCRFPMVSNLFGSLERARFIFRRQLDHVRRLIELKLDPTQVLRRPLQSLSSLPTVAHMRPRRKRTGPVFGEQLTIDQLPQLQSWPDDGGPYVTLPMVYTEHPERPGMAESNLGMYRVQLGGGSYVANREVGLHYQIHRGIGVHHTAALSRGEPLPVNVFVGGTPAMMLAAVMPLPEGMSELTFAGALAGHRIPMICRPDRLPVYAEADFCIQGFIDPDQLKPEGPFGDHLGYYSLQHGFPVLRVEQVTCRKGAIWPFTVVGRPPQEDTVFGELIHEITAPVVPTLIPGLKAVHAVDAAGVHPLMLAIGSERYAPYDGQSRPRELLTQANAILGQGQMSLAKYLLIVNGQDNPDLDLFDIGKFLDHLLRRVDWRRDLHFQTETTIDTLDYTGPCINEGSKLVVAASGPVRRALPVTFTDPHVLPAGFSEPTLVLPGVVAIQGPAATGTARDDIEELCRSLRATGQYADFALLIVVDDSRFVAQSLDNFLWAVFTRSNPATDISGVGAFCRDKHWGCEGPLVIDARAKPHHAPPLVEDADVSRRIDALATRGGPLAPFL